MSLRILVLCIRMNRSKEVTCLLHVTISFVSFYSIFYDKQHVNLSVSFMFFGDFFDFLLHFDETSL